MADLFFLYWSQSAPAPEPLVYKIVEYELLPVDANDAVTGPHILRTYFEGSNSTLTTKNYKDIDLNECIGANREEGVFDVSKTWGKAFTQHAYNVSIDRTYLTAAIYQPGSNTFSLRDPARFSLPLLFHMYNEKVVVDRLSTSLQATGTGFGFSLETGALGGLLIGSDGKWHYDEINLKTHEDYKNHKVWSGNQIAFDSKRFRITSWDVDATTGTHDLSLNIYEEVINKDGKFAKDKTSFFDTDGALAKFFENVPFIGFLIMEAHMFADNEQAARRAYAKCVYATLVAVAGAIGAACPIPGTFVLATTIATEIGLLWRDELAKDIYGGEAARDISPLDTQAIITETIGNILPAKGTGLVVDRLSQVLKKQAYKAFESKADQIMDKVAVKGAIGVTGSSLTGTFLTDTTEKIEAALIDLCKKHPVEETEFTLPAPHVGDYATSAEP